MNNPSNFIYSNISKSTKKNVLLLFDEIIDNSYRRYRELLVLLFYETLKIN
jgi:hypothetical protein